MHRQEKQLSDEQALALLRRGEWGVLCLAAGGAYGVPLNYAPDESDAFLPDLLLHCAPQGAKLDAIEKNPEVCCTVVVEARATASLPVRLTTNYASVIVGAQAAIIRDKEEIFRMLRILGRRFLGAQITESPANIFDSLDEYITTRLHRAVCIKLHPVSVTGKANNLAAIW